MWSVIKSLDYPLVPKKNANIKAETQIWNISNLFPIYYIDDESQDSFLFNRNSTKYFRWKITLIKNNSSYRISFAWQIKKTFLAREDGCVNSFLHF